MMDMCKVGITAADWNGRSFDGLPFTSFPKWLADLVSSGACYPCTPNHTDYAEWMITTSQGLLLAGPGDEIVQDNDGVRIVFSA